jgi:hypothetical protein
MNITVELWQLITLFIGLSITGLGFLFGLARFILSQIDNRFNEQQELRQQHTAHWDSRFSKIEEKTAESLNRTIELERDFLKARADMPLQYVRHEDFVRNQSIIETKLDSLALRLDRIKQTGGTN